MSYEGQPFLDARNPDMREFDPAVFYSKHLGETIEKFSQEFRSMRARYVNDLRRERGRVALVTDRDMAKHRNMEDPSHPERPERILECHSDDPVFSQAVLSIELKFSCPSWAK